ncbi:MAG: MMPL family transporter [Planctomycetota bacterium]|nr:MMPL family transporter [Planctomycetota bacterium]
MSVRGDELSGLGGRPGGTPPDGHVELRGAWRRWACLAVALCTILAGIGISRLQVDDDLRSLLRSVDAADSADDFRRIDAIAARFGGPDGDCIVRATSRSGDLFAPATLAALRRLAADLAAVDGVVNAKSIFDIRREGLAGAVLPVIPRTSEPLPADELDAVKARAIRHPLVGGHLLSADASASLILLRLAANTDAPPTAAAVIEQIETVLREARAAEPDLAVELTGLPVLRQQAAHALRRDMLIFNSLGLSLAVVLSATVARSLRSTVVACVPPFVGAVWAMGIVGLLGMPVNILTCVVPSLALVVGTCDSIHFIEDMRRSIRRGIAPVAASAGALRKVGSACGITSLVTAIGFLSLAAARIEAVRSFGLAAAAGAIASFAAVSLLTPLIASTRFCEGLRLGRSSRLAGRTAAALAAFSVRHARPIVAIGAAATIILAFIGTGVDADNRVIDALPSNATASQALARVDAEFGGVMGVDVVVRWPEGVAWRDGPLVTALDEVHGVLAEAGDIDRAISYATIAGTLPARARRRLDPTAVDDIIDPDTRTAIVRARVEDRGSRTLEGVYDRVEKGLAELAATRPGWEFDLAGMSVVSARNIRQLVSDLGASLLLEVVVIGGIMAVAFRSLITGAVSMLPNVFPLSVIAAAVVLSGRFLDPATVIVFNVCLGLAVDDTVHVLAALRRNQKEGISMATAVRRAIAETGNAVVIGGVVLCVGFAAVTVSSVPSLAGFGRLACMAVLAATAAELVLLPALLVVAHDWAQRLGYTRPTMSAVSATTSATVATARTI